MHRKYETFCIAIYNPEKRRLYLKILLIMEEDTRKKENEGLQEGNGKKFIFIVEQGISLKGAKYFATFIDNKNKYIDVATLIIKYDVFKALKNHKIRA